MKLHIKLPGCGEIHYERQPMSDERWSTISAIIVLAIGVAVIIGLPLILITRG